MYMIRIIVLVTFLLVWIYKRCKSITIVFSIVTISMEWGKERPWEVVQTESTAGFLLHCTQNRNGFLFCIMAVCLVMINMTRIPMNTM